MKKKNKLKDSLFPSFHAFGQWLLVVAVGFFCLFSIVFWEVMSLKEELRIGLVNTKSYIYTIYNTIAT